MTATIPERRRTTGRVGRRALGLIGLAALVGAGVYAWLTATSTVRDGVCATMAALVTAWDGGDATGYGSRFTEDATYTAFTGTVYRGREDIVAGHAALFTGLLESSRLHARYLGVDVVAPGVVRVLSRGDTYEGDAPPTSPSKVQTHLLVERDGRWQVAAFHNTQRKPVMERIQFLFEPTSRPLGER